MDCSRCFACPLHWCYYVFFCFKHSKLKKGWTQWIIKIGSSLVICKQLHKRGQFCSLFESLYKSKPCLLHYIFHETVGFLLAELFLLQFATWDAAQKHWSNAVHFAECNIAVVLMDWHFVQIRSLFTHIHTYIHSHLGDDKKKTKTNNTNKKQNR